MRPQEESESIRNQHTFQYVNMNVYVTLKLETNCRKLLKQQYGKSEFYASYSVNLEV